MDVWIDAHAAMHARFPGLAQADPGAALAFLTTAARSSLAELNRRDRVARGGVAKPQRRDGTVGRVAGSFSDPWLADTFRFLLGYVASPASRGDDWPLDVLTERKNAWDGGARAVGGRAARQELRADVEACLAVVRRVAGSRWLHDSMLLPLANRAPHALPGRDDAVRPLWDSEPSADLAPAATAMLTDMLALVEGGTGPGAALRTVVGAWLRDRRPTAWALAQGDDLGMQRLAKRLLVELTVYQEAA